MFKYARMRLSSGMGTVVGMSSLSMSMVDGEVLSARIRFQSSVVVVVIVPITILPTTHSGLCFL